ncbi:uncharacterized protein LOC126795762 [Argentina anserina]|uniref:uncharacterized protein LOC126795762 n=1 Tax=Argentina anserina TaxID=57926 RepID=UPI002176304A|nr:uncharacterized protein LOC126795762 [Potentilla anserina]
MMNGVALFLVLTSLVSAGVWSPSPDQQNPKKQGEEVIVKDGHRLVVIEYEDQQGHHPNTKVSISPENDGHRKGSSAIANNEVLTPSKASASVHPNRQGQGQGLSYTKKDEDRHHYSSPKELICDAYGKCKHKIASVLESRTAHEVTETARKIADINKDIIKGTAHGVKETAQKVGEVVENAYDSDAERAHEVRERAKETAHRDKDTAGDAYEKAKETVSDRTHEVGERAKESVDKAMDAAKTVKEMGKTLRGDVQGNVSKLKEAPEHVKETVEEAAEKAKETMEHTADKVKRGAEDIKDATDKGLSRVYKKGRDIIYGLLKFPRSLFQAVEPLSSGLSLFGFATAYGMSMWITLASSYVLSHVLSPHQFGMVQSKIYKVYFVAMASTVGMALLGHLVNRRKLTARNVDALQNYNLMLAELMVLFNMLYLEPRTTKVMFEKLKLEKEEGRRKRKRACRKRLNETNQRLKKLKKLNSYSSILNVLTLMALTWHLVFLSKKLRSSCC